MKTYDKQLNGRVFPVLECYKDLPTKAWNFMATVLGGRFNDYNLLMDMSLSEALENSSTKNPKSTLNFLKKHFKTHDICPLFIKEFNKKNRDTKMKTVKGDLIKRAENGEFDVIVHGCNCFHTMGAGIAGQLARKYPEVLQTDIEESEFGDKNKLGSYTAVQIETDDALFTVVNAYTQFECGGDQRYASYDAIDRVFRKLAFDLNVESIEDYSELKIGYPMIGAGLAGGDWDVIKVIIEKALNGLDHTLVIYDPNV